MCYFFLLGKPVVFRIISGNENQHFVLNQIGGRLDLVRELDYERETEVSFVFQRNVFSLNNLINKTENDIYLDINFNQILSIEQLCQNYIN